MCYEPIFHISILFVHRRAQTRIEQDDPFKMNCLQGCYTVFDPLEVKNFYKKHLYIKTLISNFFFLVKNKTRYF